MRRGGADVTTQQHINATYVSWLAMLPTSHTYAQHREVAQDSEMMIVVAVPDAELEQDVVVAAVVDLAGQA